MSSLVFISSIGAVEGNLLTAHKVSGEEVWFYHVTENRFYPDGIESSESWLDSRAAPAGHILRTRYFQALVQTHGIKRILAVGLTAAGYASRVLDAYEYTPILLRGELDFSVRRTGHVANFQSLSESASRILFEDSFEMDKAVAHGSTKPHLKYPWFSVVNKGILANDAGVRKVALVYDGAADGNRTAEQLDYYESMLSAAGYTSKRIDIDLLYSTVDLGMGRTFPATMKYRIGDCSSCIIIGDSRNTSTVIAGLSGQSNRIFIDDTFNSSLIYAESDFANAGRGVALVERLIRSELDEDSASPDLTEDLVPGKHALGVIDELVNQRFPWFYEPLANSEGNSGFDVFFTVAPIENRANGARPQRIRNIAGAFAKGRPTIRISSNIAVLKRKSLYIEWLIENGFRPKHFYGENSTAPIATYDAIHLLVVLMGTLRTGGCVNGWFVRDLHWLDPENGYLAASSTEHGTIVARGLHEIAAVSEVCDVFFAPNEESASGFITLLGRHNPSNVKWVSLPPGISVSNTLPLYSSDTLRASELRTTFVYSGGVGEVYNMDLYVQAISRLDPRQYYFDFIVRQDERERLTKSFQGLSSESRESIRILSLDLIDYIPRTTRCIGVILISSTYAKFSFPYKTMSMIERGYPILTYADMAIARFVDSECVGMTCEESVESVTDAMHEMSGSDLDAYRFSECRESNSWDMRAKRIRHSLTGAA